MATKFESTLSIHSGLGLPDSFQRRDVLPDELFSAIASSAEDGRVTAPAGGAGGRIRFDQSERGGSAKPVALRSLAGESLYGVFLMLGDADFDLVGESSGDGGHTMRVTYALEPPGSALLRGAAVEKDTRYPALVEHKSPCRMSYAPKREFFSRASATSAMDGLSYHAASGHNSPVTLGVSRELIHARGVRYQGEMESVFLRMWLAHLSVLAQHRVEVRIDRPALRGSLSGVNVARESDQARVLPGVRVNARGLTSHALALLVIGCGPLHDVAGAHPRADRYRFRTTPLTLYGTTDNSVSDVTLRDPHRTGAAIVALASRFNSGSACADALRAALTLFGLSDCGREIMMSCAEPDLHDDTVVPLGPAGGSLTSNSDLADLRLLSLSLFVGRVWRQVAGHMLRASMVTFHATDVDAAGASLLPQQRTTLREVGLQHGELMVGVASMISSPDFVLTNYGSLWSERGIVHSLAFGVVIQGSTVDEATKQIRVPFASSLTTTDDPMTRSERSKDVATLLLLQSLLGDAGEDLVGSETARKRRASTATQFTNQVIQLGGGVVQFTLLGIGSGLTVQLNDNVAEWLPPVEGKPTLDSEIVRPHPLAETLTKQQRDPEVVSVDVDTLMEATQPKGSVMRRIRGSESTNAHTGAGGEGPVMVSHGHEDDVIAGAQAEGWNVVPTSGQGLLCGAYAIASSLAAQQGKHVGVADVVSAVKDALSPDERLVAERAGIRLEDNNFTADQLAAGLQRIGNYDLVTVVEDDEGTRAFRVGGTSGTGKPVLLHNRAGHWSGVAKSAGKPIRLDRTTRRY